MGTKEILVITSLIGAVAATLAILDHFMPSFAPSGNQSQSQTVQTAQAAVHAQKAAPPPSAPVQSSMQTPATPSNYGQYGDPNMIQDEDQLAFQQAGGLAPPTNDSNSIF